MSDLTQLLKEHNLKLVYKNLSSNGYIIHTPDGYDDLIFIKDGLSEEETIRVVLHELGHAVNDDETMNDYRYNYKTRICSEHNANDYLVKEQVRKYALLGVDISSINWLDFAKSIGTDNYLLVREELAKYSTD